MANAVLTRPEFLELASMLVSIALIVLSYRIGIALFVEEGL